MLEQGQFGLGNVQLCLGLGDVFLARTDHSQSQPLLTVFQLRQGHPTA